MTEIVIDFEIGIHKAVNFKWPTAKIIGCRFYLAQAWYRKIQSLGLTKFYKDPNSVEEHFLKLFFGMPFLKPSDVEEYFLELYEIPYVSKNFWSSRSRKTKALKTYGAACQIITELSKTSLIAVIILFAKYYL
jgi:hypothetical protein